MPIQHWTTEEKMMMVWFVIITITLFLTRKSPIGFLWRWYKLFFAVLFVYLTANYAKDKVKKWWNS
jgi:hypothetical protein